MHDIRKQILRKLITHPTQRYADLKPGNVEGNLFSYHLGAVTKEGWVSKRDDGLYELTPAGKLYADRLTLKTLAPRIQPRIVTLLICRNAYGEYLLHRRQKQPLIGKVGFPYGSVHLGESVAEAAEREFKEKTGLDAELSHRGDGYVTINQKGEPISHIMFHLFIAMNPQGKLKEKVPGGQNFWARIHYLEPAELIPSVADLIRTLEQSPTSRFFAEFSYDLDPARPDILEV